MSIYPVYLASWFPGKSKKTQSKDDKFYHYAAKTTVEFSNCLSCKSKCTWKKAWGHHSIPWGYGDVWCSKKCLKGQI